MYAHKMCTYKTNFDCKKYDRMPPTRGMDVGIIWLMQCSYYQPHIVLR